MTGCKLEVPTTPSSGLINLLESLTELREILIFTSLSKDVTKDTHNSQMTDTEGKALEGLEHRSFCPSGVEGGVRHPASVYIYSRA